MRKKNLSIKQIFSQTNKFMLAVAIIPLLSSVILYSRQIFLYQTAVKNIQQANAIAAKVDDEVLEEMWDLVFGRIPLKDYKQHGIVAELQQEIHAIQENTSTNQELSTLDVSLRVLDTLKHYQAEIIANIENNEPIAKNEEIMNQIDAVTQLLADILQDFVRVEINLASQKNEELVRSLIVLSLIELLITFAIIYFTRKNQKFLDKRIQAPLNSLITMAQELSQGHLNYRAELPETPELSLLTESLNKMADELNRSLEENALKQYHLAQSEVRVLQAQITPHFVYNSLDAILSLIEQERYQETTEMTYALSDFFRISLSKGQDWISVATEMRHVTDYLVILQIRYGDLLTYEIDVPENLKQYKILKMILQPLIENAVYHGTKFIRRVGKISVAVKEEQNNLIFTITDNGIGIPAEKLQAIQTELAEGIDSDFSSGYGLYNVHKRLLLYYGRDAGVKIESVYRQGTQVTVTVPKRQEDCFDV